MLRGKSPPSEYVREKNQVEQLFGFKRSFAEGYNFIFCQHIILSYFFKCILINRTKTQQNKYLVINKIEICNFDKSM